MQNEIIWTKLKVQCPPQINLRSARWIASLNADKFVELKIDDGGIFQ